MKDKNILPPETDVEAEKKYIFLDEDELGGYISSGGNMASLYEHFEERPVQIELLKNIVKAFNKNSIGVFEAGTGVGKSYAYLIPSIEWAVTNKERIVISTGTINLQQQLCAKDIPAAKKIIGKDFKFVLMKGRQNFVCKRRFEDALAQRALFEEDNAFMDSLAEWIKTTPTGSRSDLSFMPPENIWSRINSESDGCMGMRCPFYSECFVMKMKKEAASANILVVNHHLLFADIDSRMHGAGYEEAAVLPPYRRIIFDEAHGIESAATGFFSEGFSRFKAVKQLNMLYKKNRGAVSGYLSSLSILSSNEDAAAEAYHYAERVKSGITNLETAALDLLQKDFNLRLCDSSAREFGPVIALCSSLAADLGNFTGLTREIMESIADEDKDAPVFWETKVVLRRLEDMCTILRDFALWDEKRGTVFWIQRKNLSHDEVSGNSSYVIFMRTPLDIAPLMSAGVFEPMKSVICTSATLKTGYDFSYWMRRVGISFIDDERLMQKEFQSPFPYEKNMLFAVTSDSPLPDDMQFQQYVEKAVCKLIYAVGGRTLVLFTSYESLKSAFDYALHFLKDFSGALLRQGTDDNARLLERFRKETESVLFATDSFWQGVDVPGESLSQVIIVKLPFTVPNDPIFTARAEAVEKRGGSSFMELSLPEAVIKFRQGVGRLMRSGTDRGAVVSLDKRIYEKRYGALFLSSLPECKKIYEPLETISRKVEQFL